MAAQKETIYIKKSNALFFFFFLQWISYGLRKTGNILFLFPVSLFLTAVSIYIYAHEHTRKRGIDRDPTSNKLDSMGEKGATPVNPIYKSIRSTSDDRKPDVIIPPKKRKWREREIKCHLYIGTTLSQSGYPEWLTLISEQKISI
jgi:hypothetical protein